MANVESAPPKEGGRARLFGALATFGGSAERLSDSPLGILALFIVLIYGMATVFFGIAVRSLTTPSEKLPLIWFLIIFPVVVLAVFVFLVVFHTVKLYKPGNLPKELWPALSKPIPAGNIFVPQGDEAITARHLALTSSCWRAEKHDHRWKSQYRVYRFDVIVVGSKDVLDAVDHVVYHLPPAWKQFSEDRTVQVVRTRENNFKLQDMTFESDLVVTADVHFKAGTKVHYTDPAKAVIELSHYVRVTSSGPRI